MHNLPAILKARPKANVLIVDGDEVSYSATLWNGRTCLRQLIDGLWISSIFRERTSSK
jgi:hypothetical protein